LRPALFNGDPVEFGSSHLLLVFTLFEFVMFVFLLLVNN